MTTARSAPLFVCLLAAAAALGAIDPGVLDRLDDPDYRVREEATRRLLAQRDADPAALRALYANARSPEQRHRLLDIIRHQTLRGLRVQRFGAGGDDAAIGFSYDAVPARLLPEAQGAGGGAILVVAALPGFPAYAALEAGDLVLAFDGAPLPADADRDGLTAALRDTLRQYRVGQTVRLTVLRAGERLEVPIELASIHALNSIYNSNGELREPFAGDWEAVRRTLAASAEPVPTLTPAPAR